MSRHSPLLLIALALATAGAGPQAALDVTEDGAWCWFADPRAIVVGDHLLSGWVSSEGDIVVSDRVPGGEIEASVLHAALEKDDHANPALLALPDGRAMAFYSRHTGHEMFTRETKQPGRFDEWTPERSLALNDPDYPTPPGDLTTYTYPNPVYLADEEIIALTWRGMNWKPTISFSSDLGESWTTGRILLSEPAGRSSNRPYVKVATDGRGRMHFIATDGHPRNEPTNSVYHFYYERGAFFRMDGTEIATLDSLPVRPEDADVVYDGKAEKVRAWVWDLALDDEGAPVAVYARLSQEDSHEYRYAWWNGHRWVDRKIVDAGGWFPETPEGQSEREPHYSGGVVLDHDAPSFVYLSRPIDGTFQIERWATPDRGDSWSSKRLTDSVENSVRPVVARGTWSGGTPVFWMDNREYVHYLDYDAKIRSRIVSDAPYSAELDESAISRVAADVARWQIEAGPGFAINDWTVAPFLVGLLAASEAGIGDFNPQVTEYAESIDWQLGPRRFMADDHAVAQAFLELYMQTGDAKMLQEARALGDEMLTMPFDEALLWENGIQNREWAWCDSLFMAPPMLARLATATEDPRYLDLMDRLWWKTTDYLYSPENRLFFRDSRFFEMTEANGAPVFWSRGNGWVIAGLARVLQHMPEDYPSRSRYEALFKDMAAKLKEIQREDGYWSPSLLDPETYPLPETSGTAFFSFAIAFGINEGLLSREDYMPTLESGWSALVAAVDTNGRLGWVQPVSDRPDRITSADTRVYGSGGFLLTASELIRMAR